MAPKSLVFVCFGFFFTLLLSNEIHSSMFLIVGGQESVFTWSTKIKGSLNSKLKIY